MQKSARNKKKAAAMTKPYTVCLTDIETTGLNSRTNSIIQIAALKIELTHTTDSISWGLLGRFEAKVIAPVDFKGSPYNSYDREVWAGEAVKIHEALYDYFKFLKGSSFGGQNPAFDHAFLDDSARLLDQSWPKLAHYRKLDVSSLALPLVAQGRIPNASQTALAEYFGLGKQPHDALGDVWQSFEILRRLYKMTMTGMGGGRARMPLFPLNPALKVN